MRLVGMVACLGLIAGCSVGSFAPRQRVPSLAEWQEAELREYADQIEMWSSAKRESTGIQTIEVSGERIASALQATNTQERGVDEGDLIKRIGRHLILLRKGRLFSFELGSGSGVPARKIDQIDLVPPALLMLEGKGKDGWYDELLVHRGRLVVIGYSYEPSGTEVVRIDIDAEGKFSYRETYFLPSFDY